MLHKGETMYCSYYDYDPDYYRIPKKKFDTELFEAVKQCYRNNGYTEEKDFPGEYYFMFNPLTCERVRLYYNGRVIERD
jgi:hypothetical protein